MADPTRIPRLLAALDRYWRAHPDLRFWEVLHAFPEISDLESDAVVEMIEAALGAAATELLPTLPSERACPCRHTTPCHPDCTCVNPVSSRGCLRCCTYGSREQQRMKAEYLACLVPPPTPESPGLREENEWLREELAREMRARRTAEGERDVAQVDADTQRRLAEVAVRALKAAPAPPGLREAAQAVVDTFEPDDPLTEPTWDTPRGIARAALRAALAAPAPCVDCGRPYHEHLYAWVESDTGRCRCRVRAGSVASSGSEPPGLREAARAVLDEVNLLGKEPPAGRLVWAAQKLNAALAAPPPGPLDYLRAAGVSEAFIAAFPGWWAGRIDGQDHGVPSATELCDLLARDVPELGS